MLIRYLGGVVTAEVIRLGMTAGSQVLLIDLAGARCIGIGRASRIAVRPKRTGEQLAVSLGG